MGDNDAAATRTEVPLDEGNVPQSPEADPQASWKGASEAPNAWLAPQRLNVTSCKEPLVRGSPGREGEEGGLHVTACWQEESTCDLVLKTMNDNGQNSKLQAPLPQSHTPAPSTERQHGEL